MTNAVFKDLSTYLNEIGADLREKSKSSYEVARFVIDGQSCVIYQGKRGYSGSNHLATKVLNAFLNKQLINIQDCKRKSLKEKFYDRLLERDGNVCFYTGKILTLENSSIEHLIPLSKGGKNNLDNLVLCLKEENEKMANLPLVEKIKYKIKNLQNLEKIQATQNDRSKK